MVHRPVGEFSLPKQGRLRKRACRLESLTNFLASDPVEKHISDLLIFLATIDPITTLALFVGLTREMSAAERTRVAIRCVILSALVLVTFIALGQFVLGWLDVRLESFQFAGGIIFFLFGVQMVFGSGVASEKSAADEQDIAAYPLAVPSIASPGAILACVVLTDNNEFTVAQQAITCALLLSVLGLTLVVLLQANRVYRLIGMSGATLLVRVLGLLLAAIAVEMTVEAGAELLRDLG
jgi:multiple antibiotic resistance protein